MENKQRAVRWEKAAMVFLAYCAALALSMRFALPKLSAEQQESALSEIVWNLRGSLSGTSVISTLLFAGLVGLGVWNSRQRAGRRTPRALLPVCFLTALVWLMGAAFSIDNTLTALNASPGQVVKSVCYVLGSTYLLYQLGQLLFWFLERETPPGTEGKGKLARLYRAHPFGVSFCAILLCWLPYLVVSYPGNMCYDAWNQLSQFFGLRAFTSHHPPTHTLYLGLFVQLGLNLGSANVGLYLSVLAQALIEAAVFARTLSLMEKWRNPKWLVWGSFLTVVASPYYTAYVSLALKDNLYAAGVVLFVTEVACMLEEKRDYFSSWRHWLLLAASILLTLLFRNNGAYVLYPTAVVLLVYFWATWDKAVRKKAVARAAACLLVPILLSNGIVAAETAVYHIEKNGIGEALSLPFQQTARYVKEYGDEVTEEEAAAIRAVLDYESLAERYDPRISDPVKATYKGEATVEDLLNYVSVWFKQFWKHPEVYFKATANQNYYLLYPFAENLVVYDTTRIELGIAGKTQEFLGIQEVEGLQGAKTAVGGAYRALFSLPVVSLLTHQAPYSLLLIALLVFSAYTKRGKWWLVALPLTLSAAIVILAPVIQGHPRYAFPIIYAMPIAVAYYIRLKDRER